MSYEKPTWAYEIRILIRLRVPHTPRSVSHTFSYGSSYVLIRFLIRMRSLAWRMRSLTWGSGWGEMEYQCHVDSYTSSINRISMSYRSCIDSIWMSYRCIWISHRMYIKRISILIGCILIPCRFVYVVCKSYIDVISILYRF